MKDSSNDELKNQAIKQGRFTQADGGLLEGGKETLDLLTEHMIIIPECPEGGCCKGMKELPTGNGNPLSGLFPSMPFKLHATSTHANSANSSNDQDQQTQNGHKRSRSADCDLVEFQITKANSRTRCNSVPAPNAIKSDVVIEADDLILSLNSVTTLSDSPKGYITEVNEGDESLKEQMKTRTLIGPKSLLLNNEYMSLNELVDTEWKYLQDLYLIRVRTAI
jgi:hypothetical protein